MSVAIFAYMPFIASQFYPKFYTMIPAGLLVGLGGGPLWCAKCTYLTVIAEAYSTVSDIATDVLVTRFFGLFFMFYQMAQVWGNLISSAGGSLARNICMQLADKRHICDKDDRVYVSEIKTCRDKHVCKLFAYYLRLSSTWVNSLLANVILSVTLCVTDHKWHKEWIDNRGISLRM